MNATGAVPEGMRARVGLAVGLAALTWVVLQLFRPHFFLTDDSFSLFFPVWVDFGRKWFSGGDFGVCAWIFGGSYPLLRDAVFLPLWHPFCLLFSPLAATPFQSWMVDGVCLLHVMLAAAGFECMLARLRSRGWAVVGVGAGLFLGWSYVFSMYSLLLGSSGFWYLANVSALPWWVAGLLEPRTRQAMGMLAGATFHGLVGGYPSCFLYSGVFVAGLACALAWHDRDVGRLLRNAAGLVLGVLVALPILWTPLMAVDESVRSGAIPVEVASEGRLPWAVALGSVFFSTGSMLFGDFELFGQAAHAYAIVSFAAAGWVALSLWRRRADWGFWDGVLGLGLMVAFLLVCRPDALGRLLAHLPFFGSLRWPHKEVFLLVFLLHLVAARGTRAPVKVRRLVAFASVLVFLAPLVLVGPPSLNAHRLSRDYYLSGRAAEWADVLREHLDAHGSVVCVLPDRSMPAVLIDPKAPWILLMSHNFPALWEIRGWAGYSATLPRRIHDRSPALAGVYGHVLDSVFNAGADWPEIQGLYWDPAEPGRLRIQRQGVEEVVLPLPESPKAFSAE